MKWRTAKISICFLAIVGCASPPKHKEYPVLEQVEPTQNAVKEEVVSPKYSRFFELANSLGYEPVGMQYETDANLDLLYEVFSNPIAQQREIKLIYTGIQMAYDKQGQSLTVGGMTNVTSILAYIQKNVPVAKPTLKPSPLPSPSPQSSPKSEKKSAPEILQDSEMELE